jgi:hypothetical protein
MDNYTKSVVLVSGTNKYIYYGLFLLSSAYLLTNPQIPDHIITLFENPVFRFGLMMFIFYNGNDNYELSLMVTFLFLLIIHNINKKKVKKF